MERRFALCGRINKPNTQIVAPRKVTLLSSTACNPAGANARWKNAPQVMKIYCCFTPAHEVLFKDYFLPTVPGGFTVTSSLLEIEGAGDYLSAEFLRCISGKIELVLKSIKDNWGDVIVWSDIDIQFFNLQPALLLAQLDDHDIV